MEKSSAERFEGELQKEKKRLEIELNKLHDENLNAAAADQEAGGDQNHEDHMADGASNVFERERDLSLEDNLKDILNHVNSALHRLQDGVFGVCTRCKKQIDDKRLNAIPYANLCIECKKSEERPVAN